VISIVCGCLLLLAICERARPMTIEERVAAWQAERDVWKFRRTR
jgi:hypothetical protein